MLLDENGEECFTMAGVNAEMGCLEEEDYPAMRQHAIKIATLMSKAPEMARCLLELLKSEKLGPITKTKIENILRAAEVDTK